jgi:hypothetical protein
VKKNYILIVLSLLFSLFIYLFYRTEKTVINDLFISIISCDNFIEWRKAVSGVLPLNKIIVFSLPEGLWVFAITLTSKHLYLKLRDTEARLIFLPLILSIGLELFQLLHLTNGRFDFWDIGVSVLFWAVANYFIKSPATEQNIFYPFALNSAVCILSYLIVYLAHVWKY